MKRCKPQFKLLLDTRGNWFTHLQQFWSKHPQFHKYELIPKNNQTQDVIVVKVENGVNTVFSQHEIKYKDSYQATLSKHGKVRLNNEIYHYHEIFPNTPIVCWIYEPDITRSKFQEKEPYFRRRQILREKIKTQMFDLGVFHHYFYIEQSYDDMFMKFFENIEKKYPLNPTLYWEYAGDSSRKINNILQAMGLPAELASFTSKELNLMVVPDIFSKTWYDYQSAFDLYKKEYELEKVKNARNWFKSIGLDYSLIKEENRK